MKFIIDPDDMICESNETNNSETVVRASIDDGVSVQINNPWLAGVATAIILGTVACLVFRRKIRR